VERTGCRLVILIDDIDRLQPAEILSVFKMAALSARLKNIVFLLSFDHIMIRRLLADTAKVDPAFLEKVIQKPLQLPPAEQGDIDRFLLFSDPEGTEANRSAFDHLFDELKIPLNRRQEFDKKIVYFYRKHLKRVFRTIRQAKRYLK
jgi:predicted KAP-like P-loop ATPase